MLTINMTKNEIINELTSDYNNFITNLLAKKAPAYRRFVLKSTKFPFSFNPIFLRTKSNNEWIITIKAKTKKDTSINCISQVCLMDSEKGIYAIKYVSHKALGGDDCIIYQPHFFARYRSRKKLNKNGKELIAHYFHQDGSVTFDFTKEVIVNGIKHQSVTSNSDEGIALGLVIDGIIQFKTFITYDMIWGDQIESVNLMEQYREELKDGLRQDGTLVF